MNRAGRGRAGSAAASVISELRHEARTALPYTMADQVLALMHESQAGGSRLPERVLVLTPTADDAATVVAILGGRGLHIDVVADAAQLARQILAGAGVVLIASEALDEPGAAEALQAAFAQQDAWSELPVILFGGDVEDAAARATELLGTRAQVILLERPVGIATLVSVTDAAMRSRRRQYEVKQLLEALASSAVALTHAHESAARAKDEFLATIGHELRSPMTAIRGWVQLLQEGSLTEEESTTALAMIASSAGVQARIIEDLMDLSRIVAGKVMIEPVRLQLNTTVDAIVANFRSTAAARGLDLTVDLSGESLFAWADETRLQQIGSNLLSNAIKFTPAGGSVSVSLRRQGSAAMIHVRDSGEGISAEVLPHVFERYRQEQDAPARQNHGLGLGLAIVRHLVEGQGGTVHAFSEGKGKGAEFVVSLPLVD